MDTRADSDLELTGDTYRSPLTVDATFADLLSLENAGKRPGLSSLDDAVRHLDGAEEARAIMADPVRSAATKILDFYRGYKRSTLENFLSVKFPLEEPTGVADAVQDETHQAVDVVTKLTSNQLKLQAMRESGAEPA